MESYIYELQHTLTDSYWRYVARHRLFLELWRMHRQQRLAYGVLDIGCGAGSLLSYLAKHATILPVGVDMAPGTLPYCRQRGVSAVSAADATALPFAAGTFDLVVAQDVIEHITEEGVALAEIERVLLPGGLAMILVPAFSFLWSTRDIRLHHCRRYTLGQISQAVSSVGLEPIRCTYLDLWLLPLLWLAVACAPRVDGIPDLGSDAPGKSQVANSILLAVSRAEAFLAKHLRLPFGVSALVFARKRLWVGAQ